MRRKNVKTSLDKKNELLPRPVRIKEQKWSKGTKPVVSVFIWAYNNKPYIRKSIESILMQETIFPIEIIIHDDASTDGTAEIIREYKAKYPQLFCNILQSQNQWSQGKSVMAAMLTAPKGKYVALSHGDDYWIKSKKIQTQVEYLKKNPQVSLVCTKYFEKAEKSIKKPKIIFNKIINLENWLCPYSLKTTTAMFRRKDLDRLISEPTPKYFKDIFLWRILLEKGEAHVLGDNTAVYRIHNGGVWSKKTEFEKSLMNFKTAHSMVQFFGNKEKDLRSFFRGCLKECLKNIQEAEFTEAIYILKVSLLKCKKSVLVVFFFLLKKLVLLIKNKRLKIRHFFFEYIKNKPRQSIKSALKNYFRWVSDNDKNPTSFDITIPWMSYNCVEFLKTKIKKDSTVAEFGSGGSTLFFLQHAKSVTSIEHSKKWFQKILKKIKEKNLLHKWNGILRKPQKVRRREKRFYDDPLSYLSSESLNLSFKKYASVLDRYSDLFFDFVLIDGRARPSCLMHTAPKVKLGGYLILDNTEREYYLSRTRRYLKGFTTVFDEFGPVSGIMHFNRTTIFRKQKVISKKI